MINHRSSYLIFLRGLPGSGKTTLSNYLKELFSLSIYNPDNISIDDINRIDPFLISFKKDRIKNIKYRFILNKVMGDILNHKNILWEQPWRKIENITITIENINKQIKYNQRKSLIFIIIEILIDKNISWSRSKNKFSSKPEFIKYISKYQPFNINENYILLEYPKDLFTSAKNIYKILNTLIPSRNKFHYTI